MAEELFLEQVVDRLTAYFLRNGYIRQPNLNRREEDGRKYKKGAEVRLTAETKTELAEIRRLLRLAGFKPARPFAKGLQWRQPIYGMAETERFLKLIAGR